VRSISTFKVGFGALAIGVLIGLMPSAGRAQQACPGVGQIQCPSGCSDPATDAANCGFCGNVCSAGQTCIGATCRTAQTCPSGQILCNSTCVNLSDDPQNCGQCGNACESSATCTGGVCGVVAPLAPSPVFACKFTSGKLSGTTDAPTLSGPVSAPCSDNFGSSGAQVTAVFACQFTSGPMAGKTIAPTGGVTLSGPVGQICTDNFGNTGVQVISQ
jgi:hypothetical protein